MRRRAATQMHILGCCFVAGEFMSRPTWTVHWCPYNGPLKDFPKAKKKKHMQHIPFINLVTTRLNQREVAWNECIESPNANWIHLGRLLIVKPREKKAHCRYLIGER